MNRRQRRNQRLDIAAYIMVSIMFGLIVGSILVSPTM
jgi:hypothetical protein